MKKKVAIIIEQTNIFLGGAERSVFELSTALSALGLEVEILAATGQMNAKNIHVLCRNNFGRRTYYFTFARALKKHLSENSYDIIHSVLPFEFADVYQPRGGSFAESILRNAASYQNRLIKHYKKITSFANFRRTMLLQAERKLCKNPDGPVIAALSQYVAEQFRRHYGLGNERLVVIPNGIKTHKQINTAEADRLRAQILAQLGLKEADEPTLFLFAANNFRLKGLAALIKAMQIKTGQKTSRQSYLIVAGNDRTHKYRNMAKRFKVHTRIIFLGGLRNIQNALSIADVAVLPSFYDPSSRYILEAIAAGKPVITTRFNGAVDLFVNNRHGKIIDTPENIPALAEAIDYFTDAKNIQKASQAIVTDNTKEKISITRAARELESLYDRILEKRRRR